MKVDKTLSIYRERPLDDLKKDGFSRIEIRHARYVLRRLQFLEAQIRSQGGLANGGASGGAAHAEWEVDALEWLLGPDGVDFLCPINEEDR